jgi:caffeoyl-CoA O-methyltransferase
MSTSGGYVPSAADRAWIEATAAPLNPGLLAIETAAEPEHVPILDRESGRILSVLAAGRHRLVEVGTAYGYSTLCLALGAAPDATIATIDPDRARTDLARGWWRKGGIADGRITVVNRPALEAFALGADESALVGPFDFVFIDALKEEYQAYLTALVPRLLPGAIVVADNVLWSGEVSGDKPVKRGAATEALRAFDRALLGDPRFVSTILPVGDGMLIAAYRG